MVEELVNAPLAEHGRGVMILLRQPAQTGFELAKCLRLQRDALGLQERFAVLVDINDAKDRNRKNDLAAVMKEYNPEILELMKRGQFGNPRLETYEDLEDVPVILVLCEKGKMGDSFPRSLRKVTEFD